MGERWKNATYDSVGRRNDRLVKMTGGVKGATMSAPKKTLPTLAENDLDIDSFQINAAFPDYIKILVSRHKMMPQILRGMMWHSMETRCLLLSEQ